jgi:periplasmic protein TonB
LLLLDSRPKKSANASLITDPDDDNGERKLIEVPLAPPPPDEPEPVQPPEPPVPPTPPVLSTDKLTVPIIVDDGTVVDTVLAQDSFGQKEPGVITQKGDTGSFRIVDPPRPPVRPKDHDIVEIMPEFPGGTEALLKYIRDNTKYPEIAKANGIEGTVYVQFVVDTTGNLVNIGIGKGPHRCLNEEGLRVVKSMPVWKPGMQNGQRVRVKFVVPIKFQLS